MLKAIELENFKAFGERCRIELAPITLIFGENSAGKSSILQSLNLLKQSNEARDYGALILPRTDGGIVDLGGFKEMVFDHDLSRNVAIRLEFDEPSFRGRTRHGFATEDSSDAFMGFELVFNRPEDSQDVRLDSISLSASGVSGTVAQFLPMDIADENRKRLLSDPLSMRDIKRERLMDITFAKCGFLTREYSLWVEIFERTKRRADKITAELHQLQAEGQEAPLQRSLFGEDENERQSWLFKAEEAIKFYSSDFGIAEFIDRMMRAESQTIVALDGFIPLSVRQREAGGLPELETFRRYGPTRLRMRDLTLDLMSFTVECGRQVASVLENIYPMGPFRRPPERWYSFTGKKPQNVGYRGGPVT